MTRVLRRKVTVIGADVAGADDGDLAAENASHKVLLRAAIRVAC